MVCAQFTGVSIQKDDNSFILYKPWTLPSLMIQQLAESEKLYTLTLGAIYNQIMKPLT